MKKNELGEKNSNLRNELKDLIKQNTKLEDEASSYQSALGTATSFQLRDDDKNHAVKFNEDILELNDNIKKYITNLKKETNVNMEEIKKLLLHYKCPTKITSQKADRLLIQAVLHRYIIETVFAYASQYFENQDNLESDIVKSESSLSELLTRTSKSRVGDDEITRVGSTKLRQQIYSILSNRGFANVINDGNAHIHPFIYCHKEQLNKTMNQLRTISNNEDKAISEKLAPEIIREIVKIFWFRMKVQEPVAEFDWIPNNTRVDSTIMEVNLDKNDDDDLYVDLCYFPLIGRGLKTNKPKIYTSAKVITRKFPYQENSSQLQLQNQKINSEHSEYTQQQQNQEQNKQKGSIFTRATKGITRIFS